MINETNCNYADISFLSLNVCGIKSKHIPKNVNIYISNFDLKGFQETKLTDSVEINIDILPYIPKPESVDLEFHRMASLWR